MTDFLPQLAAAIGFSHDLLWTGLLVFLRVGAAMALLPAYGEQVVPMRIRLALAAAFTIIVAPVAHDALAEIPITFLLFATETLAGLVLGIGLRLFVLALQIAGTMAAQSASLSQLFGGNAAEPQPAMSHLFVMGGLALAVIGGLHIRIAELLILSYDIFPAGKLISGAEVADWGLARVTLAFSLAFALAAPFVAASVIYNIALGVINRAMPQLMVIFVGAPALTLGGLVLLAVATPLLLAVWVKALQAFLAVPFAVPP